MVSDITAATRGLFSVQGAHSTRRGRSGRAPPTGLATETRESERSKVADREAVNFAWSRREYD